jgi:hypothetical protein
MDNTNHNLVHTLSVRLDSRWHDEPYGQDTQCEGCQRVFTRLRELDDEAIALLNEELASHICKHKFPFDLSD